MKLKRIRWEVSSGSMQCTYLGYIGDRQVARIHHWPGQSLCKVTVRSIENIPKRYIESLKGAKRVARKLIDKEFRSYYEE